MKVKRFTIDIAFSTQNDEDIVKKLENALAENVRNSGILAEIVKDEVLYHNGEMQVSAPPISPFNTSPYTIKRDLTPWERIPTCNKSCGNDETK